MDFKGKYGSRALVAGASQGIGAAFARALAAKGMDLVLIARRPEPLQKLAAELEAKFGISAQALPADLAGPGAAQSIVDRLGGPPVDVLVYNAALSYIGPFEAQSPEHRQNTARTNVVTPMELTHALGQSMLARGRGAVILMGSLAGNQGSGFLATYAASKAFNRVFAESLWYEWKDRGVDVMACCAGATSTPNYLDTQPEKPSAFAPKVQTPEAVVQECLAQLGRRPSIVTGRGNRWANFFMQKLFPRRMAVKIMGDNTRKMYRL